MSSETSTDALSPWQFFALAGLIGATGLVFVATGQTPAGTILLSLTSFTGAVVGVAAWRTLAPFTRSDETTGPAVLDGRRRAALEREKMLVLRSIKELEFDRAMGKVSDKDFADMSARLRARAAGLMRQLDAGDSYRDEIEKEISKRVGRALSGSPGGPEASHRAGVRGGDPAQARPTRISATRVCVGCRTENDPDAKFCKNCGSKLETA